MNFIQNVWDNYKSCSNEPVILNDIFKDRNNNANDNEKIFPGSMHFFLL